MLPSTFRPTTVQDFIGPARDWARHIAGLVGLAQQRGDPFALMILGKPGCGKSALSNYTAGLLGADVWHISKFNGTQFRIEEAEQLGRDLRLRDLFGLYRVVQLEEVDKASTVAQVRTLTLLDDLPQKTAFICTSNCKLNDFEARFQSRFNYIELKPPTADEIFELLHTRWPGVPAQAARHIAEFSCGNVRQALKDLDSALVSALAMPPLAQAA